MRRAYYQGGKHKNESNRLEYEESERIFVKRTELCFTLLLVMLMLAGTFSYTKTCLAGDVLRSGLQAEISGEEGDVLVSNDAAGKVSAVHRDCRSSVKIPILMYHGIQENSKKESEYFISAARFESDLKWLKKHGYTTVLPSQLTAYVDRGAALPEKPVLLTFDDGYCNNYTYAFPLLEKYHMKALISLIGIDSDLASDDIYRVEASCNLNWGEAAIMARSGLVEIGNHTYDLHQIKGGRKGADQKKGEDLNAYHKLLFADLMRNQEKIKEAAGVSPLVFAWPYGAYPQDRNADQVLKDLGIRMSVNSYQRTSTIMQGDAESLYGLGRYLRTPEFALETILEM